MTANETTININLSGYVNINVIDQTINFVWCSCAPSSLTEIDFQLNTQLILFLKQAGP